MKSHKQDSPFPKLPPGAGFRMNTSSDRLKKWKAMAGVFESGQRPNSFEEAYALCKDVCGQYEREARSIWSFIQARPEITRIAEVGRNLGGNVFLMACAARSLQRFVSLDLLEWGLTDRAIVNWMELHGISCAVRVEDSLSYSPRADDVFDFTYIDGGHGGEVIRADIRNWKERTKFIGFHDYADKRRNRHRRYFAEVVAAVSEAKESNGWQLTWPRSNSEVIFETRGTHAIAAPPNASQIPCRDCD